MSNDSNNANLHIRLPSSLKDEVAKVSEERGDNLSEMVRNYLKSYVKPFPAAPIKNLHTGKAATVVVLDDGTMQVIAPPENVGDRVSQPPIANTRNPDLLKSAERRLVDWETSKIEKGAEDDDDEAFWED